MDLDSGGKGIRVVFAKKHQMSGNLDEWLMLDHVCRDGLTDGESGHRSGSWPGFIMTLGQITSHLHTAIDICRLLQWQREETLEVEEWKIDLWANE